MERDRIGVQMPCLAACNARTGAPGRSDCVLVAAQVSQYHPALVLIASTGLRKGEALALRWDRVGLDAGVFAGRCDDRSRQSPAGHQRAQDGQSAPAAPPLHGTCAKPTASLRSTNANNSLCSSSNNRSQRPESRALSHAVSNCTCQPSSDGVYGQANTSRGRDV